MTLLVADNLHVKIADKWICRGLHLNINAGEIWGVLGPNGSGKTTLLHTLAGILRAQQGEILLAQTPLKNWPLKDLAKARALLFQMTDASHTQTVWEYLSLARYPHLGTFPRLKASDHAIMMNALADTELLPYQNKQIAMLSGGEKRRLAIASTLAQTPKLYLLDEPTNHLDVRHQVKLLTRFKSLAQKNGAAIIMALHDMNQAQQFCQHILLLFSDGSTLYGAAKDMLTQDHLSKLYGLNMTAIQHQQGQFWLPQY